MPPSASLRLNADLRRDEDDPRLRVLHVIRRLSASGGAERFAAGLALHLPQDRIESWVCAPRGADLEVADELAAAGIPVITLGRRAKWDVHRLAGLVNLMRKGRFDVVHTHMFGSNLWGMLLARATGVPVAIAHEHTWSYEGDNLRAWLDGHVIGRLATRFVAVSAADADRMVSVEGVAPDKVVVLPTAYIPRADRALTNIRSELNLPPRALVIGTASVMRPQKALHVLLQAHARVLSTIADAHLILVGDGPCRPDLERLSSELGVAARVHFVGQRGDVDAILRDLDVAVLSSAFEGTPLFVFECMANGTPLVATAVGGIPDVIEHGRSGLLVAPGQPDALAAALTELLMDPERRKALADAASERLEGFTIDTVSLRFADLYETLFREQTANFSHAGGRHE